MAFPITAHELFKIIIMGLESWASSILGTYSPLSYTPNSKGIFRVIVLQKQSVVRVFVEA